MLLSVVVPTVPGREGELARTVAAYEQLTHVPIQWLIERGHDNCGAAWNAGAARAAGEILHLSADDLEPETDLWLPGALGVIERGGVPLGWVREDVAGMFGRDFTRVPTCRREWWRDIPEIHYFSDNAFGDLMAQTGHPPMVAEGFDFYHRRSMVSRDESPERLARDRERYEQSGSDLHQLP